MRPLILGMLMLCTFLNALPSSIHVPGQSCEAWFSEEKGWARRGSTSPPIHCGTDTCFHSGRPISANIAVLRSAVLERSEEHTSELQSQSNLVCRLLLEKKKQ